MATTPLRSLTREGTPVSLNTSPHYSAGRKYSLFGAEDRVVLDLGSKIWKYGFSGEPGPRGLIGTADIGAGSDGLWDPNFAMDQTNEKAKAVEAAVQKTMRVIIHRHLMLDAKQRKIVVVESPLWPIEVKQIIARVLFGNLQCPSLSFIPSHSASLLACGLVTGLTIDFGFEETSVVPIYYTRPLYDHMKSSPMGGRRLRRHLHSLLLRHAHFVDQSGSAPSRPIAPPAVLLTDRLLDDLIGRAIFVGDPIRASTGIMEGPQEIGTETENESLSPQLIQAYKASSSATSLVLSVDIPGGGTSRPVKGAIQIPGWIRQRASEILFSESNEDEPDVIDLTLQVLSKLPIDLRKSMASSIVLCGGLAMLPGFRSRFQREMVARLNKIADAASQSTFVSAKKTILVKRLSNTRYSNIASLSTCIAVLNNPTSDPSPNPGTGSAPDFAANLLPWIGASLSVSLKAGVTEITRERYHDSQNNAPRTATLPDPSAVPPSNQRTVFQLPDLTMRHITSIA